MTIYYINGNSGDDSNDGLSESSPKRSYNQSVGVANNDIVRFACGTTIQVTILNACVGNYTLESYGYGPKPILLFGDYTAGGHIFGNATAKGPKFTIRGIKAIKLPHGDPFGNNVPFSSIGAETLIVEDCEAIGPFQHGIRVGWGDYARVARNTVQGALNCGIYTGITGKTAPSYGMYIGNLIDTPTATNDCIVLHDGNTGGVGNTIVGNVLNSGAENCVDVQAMFGSTYVGFNRLNGGPLNGSTGSGNALFSANVAVTLEGNVFNAYNTACIQWPVIACSGSLVRRNLILGPTVQRTLGAMPQMVQHQVTNINQRYINNTFVGRCTQNPGQSMFVFNSQTPTMIFKNNIVIKSALDPYSAMFWIGNTGPVGEFNNNIMVMPALGTTQYCGKTWSSFNSTFSAHATNSEETLTSPLDNRYRPLLGSSAKGMGAVFGSTCDPAGVYSNIPPSIGAYEYPIARTSRV
jgi:hypothetical protein